ncbi:MAG TPA: glyoxalase superfamily protein [Vicinamibacterales bacterium]|nr:glyoxalase superfamily protein [Vicinamibacterales bacterium]
MRKTSFSSAAPIFRVASLAASVEYYVTVLGFKIDWEEAPVITSVSRDRCCLFLVEGDQGHSGSWAWVGVGDAEGLFEELRAKGARIRHPPTNYYWGLEMQVEDLDGNVLRLGSDRKKDQPNGEWLDMHGHAWVQAPDGSWTRVERD